MSFSNTSSLAIRSWLYECADFMILALADPRIRTEQCDVQNGMNLTQLFGPNNMVKTCQSRVASWQVGEV
jgi:hypothetical protein